MFWVLSSNLFFPHCSFIQHEVTYTNFSEVADRPNRVKKSLSCRPGPEGQHGLEDVLGRSFRAWALSLDVWMSFLATTVAFCLVLLGHERLKGYGQCWWAREPWLLSRMVESDRWGTKAFPAGSPPLGCTWGLAETAYSERFGPVGRACRRHCLPGSAHLCHQKVSSCLCHCSHLFLWSFLCVALTDKPR